MRDLLAEGFGRVVLGHFALLILALALIAGCDRVGRGNPILSEETSSDYGDGSESEFLAGIYGQPTTIDYQLFANIKEFGEYEYEEDQVEVMWFGHRDRAEVLLARYRSGDFDPDALALDAFAEVRLSEDLSPRQSYIWSADRGYRVGDGEPKDGEEGDVRAELLDMIVELALEHRSAAACEILLIQTLSGNYIERYRYAPFEIMARHPGLVSNVIASSGFMRSMAEFGEIDENGMLYLPGTHDRRTYVQSFGFMLLAKNLSLRHAFLTQDHANRENAVNEELFAASHPVLVDRWYWLEGGR